MIYTIDPPSVLNALLFAFLHTTATMDNWWIELTTLFRRFKGVKE